MKLRSLAVNQFKKFATPVRLDEVVDGLNVLVGPNEMGKSTLLDALRAVLFEKYSSKTKRIRALQNVRNQSAPVVELTFELDDSTYVIRKRFINNPYAHLTCSDGRELEGEEAESTLRRLLDFSEPGRSGAQPETIGMWNVLWVTQGQSFGAPDLPESARSTLHQALESEVGNVLGGRRGHVLPKVIEHQLGELVTERNRRPRGVLKDLIYDVDTRQRELDAFRQQRGELTRTLDELEATEERLKRLTTGTDDEADQNELKELRHRHDELAALEAAIANASREAEVRKNRLIQAKHANEVRDQLKKAVANHESDIKDTERQLARLREHEQQLDSQVDRLRNGLQQSESERKRTDETVSRNRRILEVVERRNRIQNLENNCEKAQSAERRQHEARTAASTILITSQSLKLIIEVRRALDAVQGRLNAAATLVTFDMAMDRLSGIEVDGKSLTGHRPTVRVVEPADIMVPDRGRIKVEPAIADRETLLHELSDLESKLREVLEQTGVRSQEDAERQLAKKNRLLQDAELAEREIELHAPEMEDHGSGAEAILAYIEGSKQVLNREMVELELADCPTRQDAETALQLSEENADQAREAVQTARAALIEPSESLSELRVQIGTFEGRLEKSTDDQNELRRQLKDSQDESSDQELSFKVSSASKALSMQEATVIGLEGQRGDDTLPQLKTRIRRLEHTQQARRTKITTLRESVAALNSRIEVAEGAGIDEAIAEKTRQLELVKVEKARKERDVEILSLLASTLRSAEQEAKELYLSPVLNRVKPYLQTLFPKAKIHIDENLRITGIERENGYEESFQHLSLGTQEQIAMLVRLAFAEMLIERGHPATVILDDSLAFSDDQRISHIFDVLNTAAEKFQVIVFTCREQLFEGIGGNNLVLVPAHRDDLISA